MRVKYSDDQDIAYCDEYTFRRDKKTGYYLSGRPTDIGKRERLHSYVWRKEHGRLPKGYHVHHKDEDKSNNEPENLTCITAGEHERHHRKEYTAGHYKEVMENLINNAVPKSKEWHKSQEGHEWHIQHGKDVFGNREKVKKICEVCGKEYEVKFHAKGYGRFCSNNCKAAYRRKSGVDNIERVCGCCGKSFLTNKYTAAKYCSSECRNKGIVEARKMNRLIKEGSEKC